MRESPRNRRLGAVVVILGFAVNVSNRAIRADEQSSSAATMIAVPASARDRANPYSHDRDGIGAGKKLFLRHCATCHGEDAAGTRRAPSLVSDAVARTAPGELEWILRNGSMRRGMPSWSGLPEKRRWQIVAYLESLHDGEAGGTAQPRESDR